MASLVSNSTLTHWLEDLASRAELTFDVLSIPSSASVGSA